MDFFELREKEDYVVTGEGEYREDVWPDSKYIILEYNDKYEISISYNTKTFFVHKVTMTIYSNNRYRDGKPDLDFIWIDSESELTFKKVTDHNYYIHDNWLGPIRIEDEEEMDYMILKLKYM